MNVIITRAIGRVLIERRLRRQPQTITLWQLPPAGTRALRSTEINHVATTIWRYSAFGVRICSAAFLVLALCRAVRRS